MEARPWRRTWLASIIQLACIIHRTDYWSRGRAPAKLGLDQMSVSELTRYVNDGEEVE